MVFGTWTLKRKKYEKNNSNRSNISKHIFCSNAQPGSTTGGFDDEPQDVPVDGGIILLAAAGAVYGYKKNYKNQTF